MYCTIIQKYQTVMNYDCYKLIYSTNYSDKNYINYSSIGFSLRTPDLISLLFNKNIILFKIKKNYKNVLCTFSDLRMEYNIRHNMFALIKLQFWSQNCPFPMNNSILVFLMEHP